ncbi:glycogen synthase [Hydrogenophaga soli]
MRVLYACAEVFPLLKTGGLADVSAALPPALMAAGADVRLLLPAFPAIEAGLQTYGPPLPLPSGEAHGCGPQAHTAGAEGAWLQRARWPAPSATATSPPPAAPTPVVYLLHAPRLFGQPGNPYLNAEGQPWPDSAARFAWLGWAAAQLGLGLDPEWQPKVLHGHDWHTGLAPAYLHALTRHQPCERAPRTVFTVHNLAYQGLFGPEWLEPLGLPGDLFRLQGLEFHGQLSFMKAGLQYSDVLTTVSPTYAREITTPEQGCGLDGLLRERQDRLHGILNGVDDAIWNPAHDPLAPPGYSADKLTGKTRAKARLQAELGLQADTQALLCVVVSRLTEQKGLHLLPEVVDDLVQRGGQLAVLGTGDATIVAALQACADRHPQQVHLHLGYDETLAHRLMAGGDVILVPSRFEPCGLTQLYGLRYGTLPLVRAVGGLADTVTDCSLENLDDGTATGFVFQDLTAADLSRALRRAFALHHRRTDWRAVQRRGMTQPLGWDRAAAAYLALYAPPT